MPERLAIVTGTHRFPPEITEGAEPITLHGPRGDVDGLVRGDVVLVNRHGMGDRTPVHRVDHARNVTALATEANTVLAVGSCGSLRTDLAPGTVLAPHDVFAPWSTQSLFDDARAESLPGFHLAWRAAFLAAWAGAADVPIVDGAIYVHSPGPRFETPSEVRFYAVVGDVVGMTLATEMIMAGEAGLPYAAIVMVDNLANGVGELELTMDDFHEAVARNRASLWSSVSATVAALGYQF